MKCSRLVIAAAILLLVVLVFFGREMYTQEELRERLKKYEPDFGPENFEFLLKYAEEKKARKDIDFSQEGFSKILQVMELLPGDKREDINNIIKLHTLG